MFLGLSRQIKQISTDCDVLGATLEHLQREHQWFQNNTVSTTVSGVTSGASLQNGAELRAPTQENI